MKSKRIFKEMISENEKELLETFRRLKSNKYQWRFLGMAEQLIEGLEEREIKKKNSY